MKISCRRLATIVVLLLFALTLGCREGATREKFKSTDITGVDWGKDFHLMDQNGKSRGLGDYRGKVVLLFFGYTHCPDVCPTTLAKLAFVRKTMGQDADRVQVLFITVDPSRDTPQRLAAYLPTFDPTFVGLWGDEAAIAQSAKTFKVFYESGQGDAQKRDTVDHSAGIYAFDAQGRLRLFMNQALPAEDIAHDVRLLLKRE
jgi:protein SCO1